MLIQAFKDFCLELFYPKFCVGCKEYGDYVCYDCAKHIEYLRTSVCQGCGRITNNFQYCPNCKTNKSISIYGIIIASNYDVGPVREIIHHLKYSGLVDLSAIAGEMICESLAISKLSLDEYVVVPVPMHQRKQSIRGYNQAELLARYVSKSMNLKGGLALKRIIATRTQVNLTKKERLENLSGAFSCVDQELIKGRNVLLIDDVTTTGSTLNECANTLKASGAKKIYGVVVAKRI